MSGVTGGVTGTDLGFPVEYNDKLYLLFGDSRQFPPDVCEPAWCGTEAEPKAVDNPQANPEKVQRWPSTREWDSFVERSAEDIGAREKKKLDGFDSMATAPLNFDPDQCIPITFETTNVGLVFGQAITGNTIVDPLRFDGSNVAANPQDRGLC
jgi:hypothetical protein